MREAICNYVDAHCKDCKRSEDCLYFVLYEKAKQKRGYAPPTRPIIFVPPFFGKELKVKENGFLDLDVLIFGDYTRYFPYLIFGLRLLGKRGLNRFSKFGISSVVSVYNQQEVFDGETLWLNSLETKDVTEFFIEPVQRIRVNLRTPLELKSLDFPIKLEDLLGMVRRRLILYVNEYGRGKVPEFDVDSSILDYRRSSHILQFKKLHPDTEALGKYIGHTGHVEYEIRRMDKNAGWLLVVGQEIGAGPKSSYGMGFFSLEWI
ncbi:MAG: hypothetical protein AB1466_02730 [Actinomycetota bacterium]